MSHDQLEADLQDYLDGRMADDRRRAFEARLAADAGLARRVRDHRTAAEALRAGTASLSPDFYARLRARFEEPRAAVPRWYRIASWETAGLAAAVVVAAVLFVPLFLDRSPGRQADLAPEPRQAAPREPEAPGPAKPDIRGVAPEDAGQRLQDRIEDKRKEATERRAESEDQVRKDAAEAKSRVVPAEPGVAGGFAAGPPSPAPAGRERLGKTEDEPLPQSAPPSMTSRAEADEEKQSAAAVAEPQADVAPGTVRAEALTGRRAPASGTAVPAGLVEPGAWVEIDDPSALRDLARRVGDYDPTRRIVLVGDREGGLDCSASGVLELADAHEIHLVLADPEAPRDGHGCAFVLPRDGKPVRVAESRPKR